MKTKSKKNPFQEALQQIAHLRDENQKLKDELYLQDKHCHCDKINPDIKRKTHNNDILADAIPAMNKFTNKLRKETKQYAKSK